MSAPMPVSFTQVKIIHCLKSKLKMSDDDYTAMLSAFGVTSSKLLTTTQAMDIIKKLEAAAVSIGAWEKPVWTRPARKERSYDTKKYDDLGDRPGKASAAQLRLMEVLWAQKSFQPDAKSRAIALDSFIHRIVGVQSLLWVEQDQVQRIVKAIQSIKKEV
jgi:hypothetical protein